MPVRLLEELTSRRKEKVASFLTFESIVGLLSLFLPLFLISGGWPLLVRVPACAAAALLGYALTVEVQGLPLYERAIWIGRGWLRLRTQGDCITPADLPGAVADVSPDRFLLAGGPIEPAERPAEGVQAAVDAPSAT